MDKFNDKSIPFITGYARIIDRITMKPLTEFKNAIDLNNEWNLGVIHNFYGGYSQYLIEFDIWNNEPDLSEGTTQLISKDFEDCKVSVWNNEEKIFDNNFNIPFVQIRNSTFDEKDDFVNIIQNNKFDICGKMNSSNIGILNGKGDHSKFQIGINLPEGLNLKTNEIKFLICFECTFCGNPVNLFFNCYINIINYIIPLNKITTGDSGDVVEGVINGDNDHLIRIDAFNIDGNLQDQYLTSNNKFSLFLKEGIYNFIIKSNLHKREYNNFKIEKGINLFYTDFDNEGLIYKIYDDIYEYLDIIDEDKITIKKLIFGKMIDEYNNPLDNVEIIISQDNKLITYFSTDLNGKYKFNLETGIYDIRIRKHDRSIKIYKDFEFKDNKGFFTEIKKLSINFNDDNFKINY